MVQDWFILVLPPTSAPREQKWPQVLGYTPLAQPAMEKLQALQARIQEPRIQYTRIDIRVLG